MTDKELLELAAKAAGIDVRWFAIWNGFFIHRPKKLPTEWPSWNPLTDDGDALRLAVKLKIHHRQYSSPAQIRGCWCRDGYVEAVRKDVEEREPINGDPYAATRRAIVRAAAEIGKEMK